MKEKALKIEGISINYKYKKHKSEEAKDTIVILHGWGGSSDSWEEVAKKLYKSGFDVVVPDLPGFGKTILDKPFELSDYANIVEKFIKKLKLQDFILMGHSNGGAISIRIVNRELVKPKKLILNASAGIRKKAGTSVKKLIFKALSYPFGWVKHTCCLRDFRIKFYRFIGAGDYINAENNKHLKETFQNMINTDLKDEIKNIPLDTLIIWGDMDAYTPILDGYKMKKWIKNSNFIILKNHRHGIHLQDPELLSKTVVENV